MNTWKATTEVNELVEKVKEKYHSDRLEQASVVVSFDDSKPFVRNKINLGKVVKFSLLAKLWQKEKHDFCIVVPMDLWHSILKEDQREAYLDLQLSRCTVEYLPEVIIENGKKVKTKDEYGRIQFSNQMKTDDDGNPKWKVLPLDIDVFTQNVRRYGLWCDVIQDLKEAIVSVEKTQS